MVLPAGCRERLGREDVGHHRVLVRARDIAVRGAGDDLVAVLDGT
jgi:hypothetical protein